MLQVVNDFCRNDLPRIVATLCEQTGIPTQHVSAVQMRAFGAINAKLQFEGVTPLTGSGGAILLVSSLEGVEAEIKSSLRGVCRRVTDRAYKDHENGVLERLL